MEATTDACVTAQWYTQGHNLLMKQGLRKSYIVEAVEAARKVRRRSPSVYAHHRPSQHLVTRNLLRLYGVRHHLSCCEMAAPSWCID